MNNTSAEQTIIQPLCPGPGPATLDSLATRAPLFIYASRSAMRSSMLFASGAEAGAAAGAATALTTTGALSGSALSACAARGRVRLSATRNSQKKAVIFLVPLDDAI